MHPSRKKQITKPVKVVHRTTIYLLRYVWRRYRHPAHARGTASARTSFYACSRNIDSA